MKVNFQQRFCFNPPPTPDGGKRSRPSSFSRDSPIENSGESQPQNHFFDEKFQRKLMSQVL